jgi:hypothetical protein
MELSGKALLLMLMLLLASSSLCKLNVDPIFALTLEHLDTNVGGGIITNTTWTLSGSPYTVTADVFVLVGVFLTVEPGVTVKFDNGTSIIVDGTLIIEGDSAHETTFTSSVPLPAIGDWGRIGTRTGGRIAGVEWTTVEYSTDGIEFPANSSNTISDCVLRANGVGVSGSNVSATRCTFENNEDGINAINLSVIDSEFFNNTNAIVGSGTCAVQNTKVWNNSGNGIQINGTVTNCSIYDNGGYGGSSIFYGSYSWSVIYESYGRPASSFVNCSIYGNGGYGVAAASIINCSVHDNNGYGVAGPAINCFVFNNSGVGIRGNATNCLVFENVGSGVVGSCANCTIHDNGKDGVSDPSGWDAPSVVNCEIYSNNATGVDVSGWPNGSKILDSDIFNNKGSGLYLGGYAPLVSNCDIHDNLAGGIVIPPVFIAFMTPPVDCQIENSKIHDNLFGILESCASAQSPDFHRDLLVSGCNISHNVENGIMTDEFMDAQPPFTYYASIRLAVKDTIIDSNGRFGISLNTTNTANGQAVSFPILEVTNCTITNQTAGLIGNIGNVADCIIANNSQAGLDAFQAPENQSIWYGPGWITITGIHQNNICNNGICNIKNQITFGQDLNATMNWWGTTNTTEIGAFIYDYYDDYNLSRVLFEPFLTSPIPEFPSFLTLPLFMIAIFFVLILYKKIIRERECQARALKVEYVASRNGVQSKSGLTLSVS